MEQPKKKRRPKGEGALGNVLKTKQVALDIIEAEAKARRERSEQLRALRLKQAPPTPA